MSTHVLCSLLSLTKPLDLAVGDQADGESEEYVVDVVATFARVPRDSGRIRGNLRRPHRYHSGLLS